jgi:prepilin-type N-terminal cleavage/methylation domain-containing protein
MFTILRYKKGFTLIEALVAISIILVGVTAAFTVAKFGIQSSSAIRNRVTAMFLAQEAMETVRALKDSNIQKISWDEQSASWLDEISQVNLACSPDIPCGVNVAGLVSDPSLNIVPIYECNTSNCYVTISSAGLYTQRNIKVGTDSGFARELIVEPVPGNEGNMVLVTVKVYRPGQSSFKPFVLKSTMYNWF